MPSSPPEPSGETLRRCASSLLKKSFRPADGSFCSIPASLRLEEEGRRASSEGSWDRVPEGLPVGRSEPAIDIRIGSRSLGREDAATSSPPSPPRVPFFRFEFGRSCMKRWLSLVSLAVVAFFAASCSTSSIQRQSLTPRTLTVPGTGTYSWGPESGWILPERGDVGGARRAPHGSFRGVSGGCVRRRVVRVRRAREDERVDGHGRQFLHRRGATSTSATTRTPSSTTVGFIDRISRPAIWSTSRSNACTRSGWRTSRERPSAISRDRLVSL